MSGEQHVITPDPVKVDLSAPGFWWFARDFLNAASALDQDPKRRAVLCYLYCHSIELSLKAFLLVGAIPPGKKRPEKLRKIGHDLVRALERAEAHGLDCELSLAERALLTQASGLYGDDFAFTYFRAYDAMTAYKAFPAGGELGPLAEKILAAVRPTVDPRGKLTHDPDAEAV